MVGTGEGILDILFLRVDAMGPKSAGSLSLPVTVSLIFKAILTDFSFNWGEKVAPFTSSLALISSQFLRSSLCLSPAAINRSTTADAFSLCIIKRYLKLNEEPILSLFTRCHETRNDISKINSK